MSPAQINALLQIGLLAIDTYASYQRGQLSEEELAQRWKDVRNRLDEANENWENAVKKS